MAMVYFNAQNTQRRASGRASDYGYGKSGYGYDKSSYGYNSYQYADAISDKSDFGYDNYQYADATTGKIVPYIESYDIRYR